MSIFVLSENFLCGTDWFDVYRLVLSNCSRSKEEYGLYRFFVFCLYFSSCPISFVVKSFVNRSLLFSLWTLYVLFLPFGTVKGWNDSCHKGSVSRFFSLCSIPLEVLCVDPSVPPVPLR